MDRKIMLVDDDELVLSSYKRVLHREYKMTTVQGAETALEMFKAKGDYAIIISDMRMPGMNGIQLLSKIKEISPDTVRMMLTGFADFNTAIEAVNEGNIFRFLTKPCPPNLLKKAINEGLRQYELIKAEQVLLDKTLKGSVQILIEILSMIDQASFSKALKLRDMVRKLADTKIITAGWELEISAMLSQIGMVTIPAAVTEKLSSNTPLTEVEKDMVDRVPQIGHDLLIKISRLSNTAKNILYQNKLFDGNGFPVDSVKGLDIPAGARLLKILSDMLSMQEDGLAPSEAAAKLMARTDWYDPNLLKAVLNKIGLFDEEFEAAALASKNIRVKDLKTGYVLMENIETDTGQRLVMAGQEITSSVIIRINNWAKLYNIKEPIRVSKTTN